jgi:hypothetical protein
MIDAHTTSMGSFNKPVFATSHPQNLQGLTAFAKTVESREIREKEFAKFFEWFTQKTIFRTNTSIRFSQSGSYSMRSRATEQVRDSRCDLKPDFFTSNTQHDPHTSMRSPLSVSPTSSRAPKMVPQQHRQQLVAALYSAVNWQNPPHMEKLHLHPASGNTWC